MDFVSISFMQCNIRHTDVVKYFEYLRHLLISVSLYYGYMYIMSHLFKVKKLVESHIRCLSYILPCLSVHVISDDHSVHFVFAIFFTNQSRKISRSFSKTVIFITSRSIGSVILILSNYHMINIKNRTNSIIPFWNYQCS